MKHIWDHLWGRQTSMTYLLKMLLSTCFQARMDHVPKEKIMGFFSIAFEDAPPVASGGSRMVWLPSIRMSSFEPLAISNRQRQVLLVSLQRPVLVPVSPRTSCIERPAPAPMSVTITPNNKSCSPNDDLDIASWHLSQFLPGCDVTVT